MKGHHESEIQHSPEMDKKKPRCEIRVKLIED